MKDVCVALKSTAHLSGAVLLCFIKPIYIYIFWVLVCYSATQLAIQVQQECIQVVCSNREARKRPAESNSTPYIGELLQSGHTESITFSLFVVPFYYKCHDRSSSMNRVQFQFFTLNLKNSDKTKSRGVDCDRANLD